MSPEQRAQQYAQLFGAVGARWREVVPIDGTPHRSLNAMTIDGVQIKKSDTADAWGIAAGDTR